MTITLNGESAELAGREAAVRAVLASKGWSFPLIIVKVNGNLVRREDWDAFTVRDGDSMEAIHLVSGG